MNLLKFLIKNQRKQTKCCSRRKNVLRYTLHLPRSILPESFRTEKLHIADRFYFAAVADYRPKKVSDEKIKKSDGRMVLEMERTEDILGYLGAHKREGQFLCGFSMETENMLENSKAKLAKKHVDMIVANNLKVQGAGFGTDTNIVTIITKENITELELLSKDEVAKRLLDEILALRK